MCFPFIIYNNLFIIRLINYTNNIITMSNSDQDDTRVLLETFPTYVDKLLNTVDDFPENIKKRIELIRDKFNKDSIFWAPELNNTKRAEYKHMVHYSIRYTTERIFVQNINKYRKDNNCSDEFAKEEMFKMFKVIYPWYEKYNTFINTYK